VQAAADLAKALLQAGARVKVLATTRDALQIAGEAVYHLQPLSVPAPQDVAPAQLAQHASVQLFLDRATSVQPSFQLTDRLAGPVAEICRRLDGIPLALELAAARARSLSVEAIAARLDQRFRVLVAGDRTVLPRQRTLRALIDWSHDLLNEDERAVFRRLSVFAGGWTVAAAEGVVAGHPVASDAVLEHLSSLVEKSLVVMDAGNERYRMLDTVRHYGREQLALAGEDAAVRDRHLAYFLALAEAARPALTGPDQAMWFSRLDQEGDDILAAHLHARESAGGGPSDLRLAFAMRPYFIQRGLLALGHQLAVEALAHAGAQARDLLRCQALHVAGQLCCFLGRYEEAIRHLNESAVIADELGDAVRRIAVQLPLGMAHHGLGDLAQAQRHFEQGVQMAEAQGNARSLLAALNGLAQLHRARGDVAQARPLYERVLQAAREVGDSSSTSIALLNLCMLPVDAEHYPEVRSRLLEVLAVADVGQVAQSALEVCAGLSAREGHWTVAAELFGAVDAQALYSGLRRDAADEAFLAPLMARTREALGAEQYDRLEAGGRTLPLTEALARARAWLQEGAGVNASAVATR
jgi:predicted ATPase